jgi:L-threonylcarbamoyladenylate synthase
MTLPFRTADDVARAVEPVRRHLDQGGVIGYPTETVYGLGTAPAEAPTAKLSELKGRPQGKPFLLLVSTGKMAKRGAWCSPLPPPRSRPLSGPAADPGASWRGGAPA